jgi:hypothetical protein
MGRPSLRFLFTPCSAAPQAAGQGQNLQHAQTDESACAGVAGTPSLQSVSCFRMNILNLSSSFEEHRQLLCKMSQMRPFGLDAALPQIFLCCRTYKIQL